MALIIKTIIRIKVRRLVIIIRTKAERLVEAIIKTLIALFFKLEIGLVLYLFSLEA
jgi:hypothetical protein